MSSLATIDFRRMTVRSAPVLKGNRLGGYAAVFDEMSPFTPFGPEELAPGSFTRALGNSDPRALFNHDPNFVLGRLSTGTLRLAQDSTGLEYEIDMPDTQLARDVRELVSRGDIDGASFQFVPGKHEMRDGVLRHTDIAELIDVSPVTFPAYAGATSEARSKTAGSARRSQLIRARAHALRSVTR